jgi:acyl-CoA dehydrogenase
MAASAQTRHESGRASPWFTPEHELLRDQVRRFVDEEIKPNGDRWEEEGCVPRDVLRRMGQLGFFGIRYPEEYGGSGMDVLATVVLAEELGRSTYGGAAITALVHTDMASVHVWNAGTKRNGIAGCRASCPVRSSPPSPSLSRMLVLM